MLGIKTCFCCNCNELSFFLLVVTSDITSLLQSSLSKQRAVESVISKSAFM